MTTINRQTRRMTHWLSRAASRNELRSLSDRALQDIGVVRQHPGIDACKPFWMA